MLRDVSPFVVFAAAFTAAAAIWAPAGGAPIGLRVVAAVGCVGCAVATGGESSARLRTARALLAGALFATVTGGVPGTGGRLAERLASGRMRAVVEGRVIDSPEPLRNGWGLTLQIRTIDDRAYPRPVVRLFVPPERLEGAEPPWPGDRVRVFAQLESYPRRRFPGRTGRRRQMARRGVAGRGVAEDTVEILGRSDDPFDRLARHLAQLRIDYVREVYRHVSARAAGYATAMTAGTRGLLAAEQTEPFRRTGTGHLLAISGLHLGILAALLWKVFGALAGAVPGLLRRWGRRRVCALPVVATLGAYVWAIGAPVSAFRAFVMVAAVVGALAAMRPVDSLHGLGVAAVALLAEDPVRICELGFQLSFAATGAILWFLRRRPPALRPDPDPTREASLLDRWRRRIGLAAGVSTSATLATWPILLAWHGWVPADAIWVNIVVTPLASVLVVPVLFAGAVATLAAPTLGAPLLDFGGGAMAVGAELLSAIAEAPPYGIVLGRLSFGTAMVLGVGCFLWIGSRGRLRPVATGAALIALSLVPHLWSGAVGRQLQIHFIPVGQGDATLVEFPDGRSMLVDAGGSAFGSDPGRRTVAPYLRRIGVGRLDWVVGTHGDVDHVGGLPAVGDRLRPRAFLYDPRGGPSVLEVAERLERDGTRLEPVASSRRWRVGGVAVRVLRPMRGGRGDNDRSLVTVLRYGGRRVVLPGDVEAQAERRLVRRLQGKAAVLKVPHHGSQTSSTPQFLDTLRPDVAVVSAGRYNPFGHPDAGVERRYRARGVRWIETARVGLVRLRIDPSGNWTIRTVRRAPSRSTEHGTGSTGADR